MGMIVGGEGDRSAIVAHLCTFTRACHGQNSVRSVRPIVCDECLKLKVFFFSAWGMAAQMVETVPATLVEAITTKKVSAVLKQAANRSRGSR